MLAAQQQAAAEAEEAEGEGGDEGIEDAPMNPTQVREAAMQVPFFL